MDRVSGAVREVQEFIGSPNPDQNENESPPPADEDEDDDDEAPEENRKIHELTSMIDSITQSIQTTRQNVVKMKETTENSDKLLNLWQSILFFNKQHDLKQMSHNGSGYGPGSIASQLDLDPEELEEVRGLESDDEVMGVVQEKKSLSDKYSSKKAQYDQLRRMYSDLKSS